MIDVKRAHSENKKRDEESEMGATTGTRKIAHIADMLWEILEEWATEESRSLPTRASVSVPVAQSPGTQTSTDLLALPVLLGHEDLENLRLPMMTTDVVIQGRLTEGTHDSLLGSRLVVPMFFW